MVAVTPFPSGYVGSQEALEYNRVGYNRIAWREILLPALKTARERGITSFTVTVPIEILGFKDKRYNRRISFFTDEFFMPERPTAETVLGIKTEALSRFALLAKRGIEDKPQNFLDYTQLATEIQAAGTIVNPNQTRKLMHFLRYEIIAVLEAKKEKLDKAGKPDQEIKLPEYMHIHGQVFRSSQLGYFYNYDDRQRPVPLFCVQNGEAVDKVAAMYNLGKPKNYAFKHKSPESAGESEEEILGMSNSNALEVRKGVMDGYTKWLLRDQAYQDANRVGPKTFTADVELVSRTGKEICCLEIDATKCGFYYLENGMSFGIDKDFLQSSIASQFTLKWRNKFNTENYGDPEKIMHDVKQIKDIVKSKLRGEVTNLSILRAIADRVNLLAHEVLNKVLAYKLSAGNEVVVEDMKVALADVSFHRVTGSIRYSISEKLLNEFIDKASKGRPPPTGEKYQGALAEDRIRIPLAGKA